MKNTLTHLFNKNQIEYQDDVLGETDFKIWLFFASRGGRTDEQQIIVIDQLRSDLKRNG